MLGSEGSAGRQLQAQTENVDKKLGATVGTQAKMCKYRNTSGFQSSSIPCGHKRALLRNLYEASCFQALSGKRKSPIKKFASLLNQLLSLAFMELKGYHCIYNLIANYSYCSNYFEGC